MRIEVIPEHALSKGADAAIGALMDCAFGTGAGYNGPTAPEFDRLFIAPAHYALVAYATLIEVGRMAPEGLEMFNKDGSSVEMIGAEHSPGMEVHNGTLGIGFSTAAGLAWGRSMTPASTTTS